MKTNYMLFTPPSITVRDRDVMDEIEVFRRDLRYHLSQPQRWDGNLRRSLQARAIRGSNSIEGNDVTLDDALAAVENEETLDADERTTTEIVGYRNALTFIQQLTEDSPFSIDQSLVRSLHFIMLGHDLSKRPGRWRTGAIYVHDEKKDQVVYEGPDADLVPGLMKELAEEVNRAPDLPVFVRGAMAHLNLVMIHPFVDGNGRMARTLQTLVLARGQILAPEFSSIEEWLGKNTGAYYCVLARVGAGAWHPERDTAEWIRFNLVAHHMQAQTVARRLRDGSRLWEALETTVKARRLPERCVTFLYDAALGLRMRRSQYERNAGLEAGTAGRDLRMMTAAGLLEARGEARARHYVGTRELRGIWAGIRKDRTPLRNPYTGDAG